MLFKKKSSISYCPVLRVELEPTRFSSHLEYAAAATYTSWRNVASGYGSALISYELLLLLPWISAAEDKQPKFQDAASARGGKETNHL